MIAVKIHGTLVKAEACWQNQNTYLRYDDEGRHKIVKTVVCVKAPDHNLRELMEKEIERQKREIEEESYAEGPVRIGVRSYASSTIGEQDPLGYYEDWEIESDHLVKFKSTNDSHREPGESETPLGK